MGRETRPVVDNGNRGLVPPLLPTVEEV